MGAHAAEVLLGRIDGGRRPARNLLRSLTLVVRESSALRVGSAVA
jgi:DNA-binding LacI/PurR family transcriptional regulator